MATSPRTQELLPMIMEADRQSVGSRHAAMIWIGVLLKRLREENEIVAATGPAIIPQLEFSELATAPQEVKDEIRKRGVSVIKSAIPQDEARNYKNEIEQYVKANSSTKGIQFSVALKFT